MQTISTFFTLFLIGCLAQPLAASPAAQASERTNLAALEAAPLLEPSRGLLVDRPLSEQRRGLLQLAFDAASKLPLVPHVKNRSRGQATVIEACLELDQPLLALRFADQIVNWRRGACLADIAAYAAQHGAREEALQLLERASAEAARASEQADQQQWRVDRIWAKSARAHALLGDLARATELEAGVQDSEAGLVDAALVRELDSEAFDAKVDSLVAACGPNATFEQLQFVLDGFVALHARFYADAERRARLESLVETKGERMPVQLLVETWESLADTAIDANDREHALVLVERVQTLVDRAVWPAEAHVPLLARLAVLRAGVGQAARAESLLAGARTMFAANRDEILNLRRADALLPVAEAYCLLGKGDEAAEVFGQAIDEAGLNPNARPRADDVVELCCALAAQENETSASVLARLQALAAGLQAPW